MTQYLRRRVLKLFLDKRLISRSFAENLLRWRHSGFSIDHSVRLHAHDQQARWALSQYIARPPLFAEAAEPCPNRVEVECVECRPYSNSSSARLLPFLSTYLAARRSAAALLA